MVSGGVVTVFVTSHHHFSCFHKDVRCLLLEFTKLVCVFMLELNQVPLDLELEGQYQASLFVTSFCQACNFDGSRHRQHQPSSETKGPATHVLFSFALLFQ